MLKQLGEVTILSLLIAKAFAAEYYVTLNTDDNDLVNSGLESKPLVIHIDKNSMDPEVLEQLANIPNIVFADLPGLPQFVNLKEYSSNLNSGSDSIADVDSLLKRIILQENVDYDRLKSDERFVQVENILNSILNDSSDMNNAGNQLVDTQGKGRHKEYPHWNDIETETETESYTTWSEEPKWNGTTEWTPTETEHLTKEKTHSKSHEYTHEKTTDHKTKPSYMTNGFTTTTQVTDNTTTNTVTSCTGTGSFDCPKNSNSLYSKHGSVSKSIASSTTTKNLELVPQTTIAIRGNYSNVTGNNEFDNSSNYFMVPTTMFIAFIVALLLVSHP